MANRRKHPPLTAGQRFGSWLVVGTQETARKVLCRCDCGTEKLVQSDNLRNGKTSSCGCVGNHLRARKHGLAGTPEYQIWKAMKARCYQQGHKNFADYGGRGIKVCDRWKDDFEAFYVDMGKRPNKKHSIDRIDCEGDYSPENCRWATQKEQTNNTRRSKNITYQGETKTVAEWSEITGIGSSVIYHRLAAGWNPVKAITAAPRPMKRL